MAGVAAVVAAERAFAAKAAETGWVEAYEVYAAEAGVVVGDGPQNARDFAKTIHPDVRGDTSLRWAPEFAGASAAGDFGFTAGPFNGDGAAFGHYVTVWAKQPDGTWRWLFEGGIDVAAPTAPETVTTVMEASAPAAGEGSAEAAKAAVAALEAELSAAAAADVRGALAARMAEQARMQREALGAVTGAEAIAAMLAQRPAKVSYRQLLAHASPAGDMVFTLGEAGWEGGSEHYARVWTKTRAGWRIVLDQM